MGYAGEQGLYGIGAGFTDKWCSAKNGGYEADMLVLDSDPSKGAQGCQIYSPYAVAGYLPAAIPGGEPSNDCLKCWQAVCSAVKSADCQQCMTDSKDSCIAICKPSLFGQKMRDWFCQS